MTNPIITQEELKSQFHYDVDTGLFTRISIIRFSHAKVGDISNCIDSSTGYIRIMVNHKIYQAHRLAWLYMTGKMPKEHIDHINRVRNDNRWCNLRLATNAENCRNRKMQINNTSGYKGVSLKKATNKYIAQAKLNGKKIYIGTFNTAKLAGKAYQLFAKQNHGNFYRKEND
jgi:HNH endonuclease/AP2 domain